MTAGAASRPRLLLAGGILVDPDTFVPGGVLRVERGTVRGVRAGVPRKVGGPVEDLRPAVLAPGLIDAHAHFDLTRCAAVRPTESFAGWLRGAISARRSIPDRSVPESAREGARMLLARGGTAGIDFDGTGRSAPGLAACPIRALVLREVIAPDPGEAKGAIRLVGEWLRRFPSHPRLAPGIAPHAPFTVSAPLYASLARLARAKRLPFSTHLAESPEETEFLLRGGGPLRELLEERGRLPARWRPPGLRPLAFLESAGALGPETLLVHGNDLTREECSRIARAGATIAVCPGTHLHFGRPASSVRRLFESGVRLALGTDGMTSNDRLDLFAEMARLRALVPRMPAGEVFRAATAAAGRHRGFPPRSGTLAPGAPADFLVLEPPGRPRREELLEFLTAASPVPRAVFVAGRRVAEAGPSPLPLYSAGGQAEGAGPATRPGPR